MLLELTNEYEKNCREGSKIWQLKGKVEFKNGEKKERIGDCVKRNVSQVERKMEIYTKLF